MEADISVMGARIDDKKYSRPANPALALLGDVASEMIISFKIRVTNVIVEAGLEQICDVCGIKLRRVKRLQGLDSFNESNILLRNGG